MLLERLPEAELQIDELRLADVELDPATQDVDVGLPAAEPPVEDVERRERLRVARLVLEDLNVGVDRAIDVLDLVLVELRDLVVDRLLLVGRRRRSRFFS